MENAESGPLRAPDWTDRSDRRTLGSAVQLGGGSLALGWYEVRGGFALISDPRGEGASMTLRASVWKDDPRPALRDALELPTQAMPLSARFVENWPQLLLLARGILKRTEAAAVVAGEHVSQPQGDEPEGSRFPEQAPASARVCGDPTRGGHYHIGDFAVAFAGMTPDELREVRESGSKPSEETEVLLLEDGALLIDLD